jgi:cytochrome c2
MMKKAAFTLALLAAAGTAGGAFAAGDAAKGQEAFAVCQTCHTGEDGAIAPDLNGVVGRKAAADPDFALYTEALKGLNVTWTPEELDKFLASPMTVAPGTQMIFPVADAAQRADLIAYLETLKAE